ncbi:MAG: alpha/beta hydrolase [Gemmatimonadaceae bacterium]|jgi:acetyl esterase/lipase|nr:alpha/beta hydrolase [Gemmatimonadaceae bacterium]
MTATVPPRWRARACAATLATLGACGTSVASVDDTPPVLGPPAQREFFDQAYAAAFPRQRLDLYLPPTGSGPWPVVLWIHGGGWQEGSKALDPTDPVLRLRTRGYAVASIGYRLSGQAAFPAQIHDVKAAVRFLRQNAAGYRLNPSRMAAWGASAGGHLAALLGTSGAVSALEDLSMGFPTQSSRVQAVIDWYGPTDFGRMDEQTAAIGCPLFPPNGHGAADSPESRLLGAPVRSSATLVQFANPVAYVTADDPPFLIQHGTRDCTVPPGQSELLQAALTRVGGAERSTLDLLTGAGHGGGAFTTAANIDRIVAFLSRALAP